MANFIGWVILCGFCGVLIGIITSSITNKFSQFTIIAIYLLVIAALSTVLNSLNI